MHKVFDIDKFWAYLATSLIGFFEPISVLLLWMFIFIIADTITGIHASIVERKIIESCKLKAIIYKTLTYCLTIVLLEGIDKYMIVFSTCYLANIGATIICGIEFYSILENFYRITGNKVFKVLTKFTLKKIQDETGVTIDDEILNKPVQKKGRRKANGL